jgi:hypothetical protein
MIKIVREGAFDFDIRPDRKIIQMYLRKGKTKTDMFVFGSRHATWLDEFVEEHMRARAKKK